MQKIFSFVFSRKILVLLLFVFGTVYLFSLYHRFIQSDENWFGEEAYYFVKDGIVKLKSMPVVYHPDQQVFVIHKLFVYLGSVLIGIFGWSLWPLKIFIFFCYALFIFIFNNWLKGSYLNFNFHQRLLTIFILATTPIMIEQTFIFRPEVIMMLLVFMSFVFINKGLKEDSYYSIALGALFAAVSFLVHLNGNAIVVAGFLYILSLKRFKSLLVYSSVAGIVCLMYFIDIFSITKLHSYFAELRNISFNVYSKDTSTNSFLVFKLNGLLSEHQRFFWSDRVSVISAFFFISLISVYKDLRKKYPELIWYFVILVICGNLFGSFIAERYVIYYLPFMAIIIAFAIFKVLEQKAKILPYIFVVLMIAHITAVIIRFNSCIQQNYDHEKVHSEILSHIPKQSKVLAPWEFIYNGIADYNIVSFKNIEYYHNRLLDKKELNEVIAKLNTDYIIVSDRFDDYSNVNIEEIRKIGINSYKPIYSDKNYTILKKD